jgi:LacI family transcriptional regulator
MLDVDAMAGVLVIANPVPDDFLRTIYQSGKPLSLISHQVPDLPIPVVMSNNEQGIAALVKHLVTRCERRKLVFVRGIPTQSDAAEREVAFRQELRRYNLQIPENHYIAGDFSPETAAHSLHDLIANNIDFDAVVAADYLMAMAAIEELEKAGIKVPEQVSVVGFGDALEARTAGITTVSADVTELGRRAAAQLLSQINNMPIRGVTVLNVQLIVRESCGCLAGVK